VGEGTFSDRELDGYRAGADRFIAELDEEYYLHYAGLKPEFELRSIYERHADLTDLETIKRLGETVQGKQNLELFRFGCEGYLGELTRENAEKIAELEAKLEIQHEGEPVGYRMLPPTIANTAERDTRARLEQSRNELTEEHLNPLYLDAVHATQRAVPELGAPTYFHLYRDRFEYDLEGLAAQCRVFLDSTERLYEESMDRVLRERVGVGLAEAERLAVVLDLEAGLELGDLLGVVARQLAEIGLAAEAEELEVLAPAHRRADPLDRLEVGEIGMPLVDRAEVVVGLEPGEVAVVLLVELGDEAVRARAVPVELALAGNVVAHAA